MVSKLADAARLSEIDVAGQLAQDQDIEPGHHFGLQGRGIGEFREDGRRPHVGKQVELLA
jgi:hypothetical protein